MYMTRLGHESMMDSSEKRYPVVEWLQQSIHIMMRNRVKPSLIMCDFDHYYYLNEELNSYMSMGNITRMLDTPETRFYLMRFMDHSLIIHEMPDWRGIDIFARIEEAGSPEIQDKVIEYEKLI